MVVRAVIVGGGIAGVSLAKVLAARGVAVTLLERTQQLCSGSTWHAAGLVTRFAGSGKLKKLHVRSMELLTELHAAERAGGGSIGLHTPGSLRLIEAGDADRLREAHQHVAMARLYDTDAALGTTLVSKAEVAALHPLLDVEAEGGVECAIWTPADGDVDPTMLTHALARLARADGAELRLNSRATRAEPRRGGGFLVHTETTTAAAGSAAAIDTAAATPAPLECDLLFNAAGLWSKRVGRELLGIGFDAHPAFVIEHQYVVTEPSEAVAAAAAACADGRLPVLRDLAGSQYIRQEGASRLLVGPYEADVANAEQQLAWDGGPPESFGMELFPGELERLEANLLGAMARVPAFGEVGISSVTNGPTIWAADALPRVGATPVRGYFDFNTLTYGSIAHALLAMTY